MICKLISSCMLVFSGLTLSAQLQVDRVPVWRSTTKLPGIQIGEQVPDVMMEKIIEVDGSVRKGKLSDYKDRLLILDFMATSCSSCVVGLVKKDRLQNQFGEKIKILVVVGGGYDRSAMLKLQDQNFIQKYLTSKNYLSYYGVKIPWVVEHKVLNDYFPHIAISHLVWINKGKVIAITDQDYVTAENIQLVLDGKKNDWPVKNDYLPAVDVKMPLVKQFPQRLNRLIAQNERTAIFGVYQDGAITKHGTIKDSINKTRRDYSINIPLVNIYALNWFKAAGILPNLIPSKTILEVGHPEFYMYHEDSTDPNFIKRHKAFVSVEFNTIDSGQTEQQQAIYRIRELDKLLGLKGRYEKRKMKCQILYCISDNAGKFKSISNSEYNFNASSVATPNIHINRDYLRELVYSLNQQYGNPPVFDETGYEGLVDIKFSLSSWKDIPAVRTAIRSYGLDLREEEREVEVFVLSEVEGI